MTSSTKMPGDQNGYRYDSRGMKPYLPDVQSANWTPGPRTPCTTADMIDKIAEPPGIG